MRRRIMAWRKSSGVVRSVDDCLQAAGFRCLEGFAHIGRSQNPVQRAVLSLRFLSGEETTQFGGDAGHANNCSNPR
jgi:hypothetical protein